MHSVVAGGRVKSSMLALLLFAAKSATIPLPGFDLAFFLVVLCLYLLRVKTANLQHGAATLALILFWVWAGLSFNWRGNLGQEAAFLAWLNISLNLCSIYLLFGMFPAEKVGISCLRGGVLGASVMAAQVLFFVLRGMDIRSENSDFFGANYIGGALGLGLLCALHLIRIDASRRYQRIWRVLIPVFGIGLLVSLSKTALLAVFSGLAIYFVVGTQSVKVRIRWALALLLLGAAATAYIYDYLETYFSLAQDGEALESLSGRTFIWLETLFDIDQNPYLGYGVRSFVEYGPQIADVPLVHAHNELLQTFFSYGVVGVVLLVFAYFAVARRAVRQLSEMPQCRVFSGFCLAIVAFAIIRGLTEAHDAASVLPIHFFFMLSLWGDRRRISSR